MKISGMLAAAALAWTIAAPLDAVDRMMFVTSTSGTGDLSTWAGADGFTGLAAGDAICQARASAAGLANASAYRAWLSDAADDAYCRLHGFTGKRATNCGQPTLPTGAGPWWRRDWMPFGAALPELADPLNEVLMPARINEYGAALPHWAFYLTGTLPDGTVSARTCLNWTSAASDESGDLGDTERTSAGWTYSGNLSCSSPNSRLLCLEAGSGAPLPVEPASGRLAFVSSAHGAGELGAWTEAQGESGLAAGDAICRHLAAASGVRQAESFKAWLSVPGVNAEDRFEHDGPWMRLDGMIVAWSLADLTDGWLATSLHLTEQGSYLGYWGVWTGTASSGEATGDHCSSWSSALPGDDGHTGTANAVGYYWTSDPSATSCDFPWHHLYCLQDAPILFIDGFESGSLSAWTVPPM